MTYYKDLTWRGTENWVPQMSMLIVTHAGARAVTCTLRNTVQLSMMGSQEMLHPTAVCIPKPISTSASVNDFHTTSPSVSRQMTDSGPTRSFLVDL